MSLADTIAVRGFSGKYMLDIVPFTGDGKVHKTMRYDSANMAAVEAQAELVQICGAKGVRLTWQGAGAYLHNHEACMMWKEVCVEMKLLFALLLDPAVAQNANWYQDDGFLEMAESPAYIPEKYLCDFSTGIDFTKVALPSGFSVLANQKGFGWANAYPLQAQAGYANPTARTLKELQDTNANPLMKWPFLTNGFFDAGFPLPAGTTPATFKGDRDTAHSVWSQSQAARYISHEAGNTWYDCLASAAASCPNAPYISEVGNDDDEGQGILHVMSAYAGVRIGA